MIKKLAILASSIWLAAVIAVPSFAAASSALSPSQINNVVSLLESFGVDQPVVAKVEALLGGNVPAQGIGSGGLPTCSNLPPYTDQPCMPAHYATSTPVIAQTTPTGCIAILTRNLTLGSVGSDVTDLQDYLIGEGYLGSGYDTGYYGHLTASAVGKLQVARGIVYSESDQAYGIAGPRTRAAIGCSPVPPAPAQLGLFATPSSGAAPLEASFFSGGSGLTGDAQYIIEYGDGANSGPLSPSQVLASCLGTIETCPKLGIHSLGAPGNFEIHATHTYTSPGTYTASLESYVTCPFSTPRCMIATLVLARVTIPVTGTMSFQVTNVK